MTEKSPRKPKVTLAKPVRKTKKPKEPGALKISPDLTATLTSSAAMKASPQGEISTQDDPFLAALTAHEVEIARLHDIILALRNQEVRHRNANLGVRPVQAMPISVDRMSRLQSQVEELKASLQEAWAELELKQAHLQSAVSQAKSLQARLDAIEAGGGAHSDGVVRTGEMGPPDALSSTSVPNDLPELLSLRQQLATANSRLAIALGVIARHGYTPAPE